MIVRSTKSEDIAALQHVIDQTEMFPSEMLPEMIDGYLSGTAESDIWLTCEIENSAIGFCYCTAEKLTDGTWNMLAISVSPAQQSKGVGAALVSKLEEKLRKDGQRLLIVDTSSTPDFDAARRFYVKNGYIEEARIRDFWALGSDKITYRKSLV
jgi:ribosomal protein S18 acetylase RimI-like enzyme